MESLRAAASNPNLPLDVIAREALDDDVIAGHFRDAEVNAGVLQNPALPLSLLADFDQSQEFLVFLLRNEIVHRLPAHIVTLEKEWRRETRDRLVNALRQYLDDTDLDEEWLVRVIHVAFNPSILVGAFKAEVFGFFEALDTNLVQWKAFGPQKRGQILKEAAEILVSKHPHYLDRLQTLSAAALLHLA